MFFIWIWAHIASLKWAQFEQTIIDGAIKQRRDR